MCRVRRAPPASHAIDLDSLKTRAGDLAGQACDAADAPLKKASDLAPDAIEHQAPRAAAKAAEAAGDLAKKATDIVGKATDIVGKAADKLSE